METIFTKEKIQINKESFKSLPSNPGIYIFWKGETPIYIGKSINLKSRLQSYLLQNLGIKTSEMVKSAEKVSFIEVFSELESLLLESSLIHKFKPKYNIISKDDKHPLYIAITNEEFPRVITVRKTEHIKPKHLYGPFPSAYNVKLILKMLRRIFPFSDHKLDRKACLYSHIGLCNPCPNVINSVNDGKLKERLVKKYKDNIRNINLILSRKFNQLRNNLARNMEILSQNQQFEEAKILRDKIRSIDYITQPRIPESMFLENPNLREDIRQDETRSLKQIISKHYPGIKGLRRIECFDVAHLSGLGATASMVVFIDGERDTNEYRHFKIRQDKRQSDYDSMKEIARRRLKQTWDRPDLIIVDGGLGQVKIFNTVFSKIGVPVVGLAKNPDRLIFPSGHKIRPDSLSLRLVQRLRDEAHRFARRYHHMLIRKSLLDS